MLYLLQLSEIFIFQLLKEEKGLCITFECEKF
jgi:hypothetical protein